VINVLIVDDDAMVADLNRLYVNRVEGFSCCGVASTLNQAEAIINNPSLSIWCCWMSICSRITGWICCPSSAHPAAQST
jgi:DNA-binding NarL/FixJ family response regulator